MVQRDSYLSSRLSDIEAMFLDFLRLYFRVVAEPESLKPGNVIQEFLVGMGWAHLMTDRFTIPPHIRRSLCQVYRIARVEHHFRIFVRLHAIERPLTMNLIHMGFQIASKQMTISGYEAFEIYRRMTLEMPEIERVNKSRFLCEFVLSQGTQFDLEDWICYQEILRCFGMFMHHTDSKNVQTLSPQNLVH